jgi:hypothetical protein
MVPKKSFHKQKKERIVAFILLDFPLKNEKPGLKLKKIDPFFSRA